jgi:hypothetical protein
LIKKGNTMREEKLVFREFDVRVTDPGGPAGPASSVPGMPSRFKRTVLPGIARVAGHIAEEVVDGFEIVRDQLRPDLCPERRRGASCLPCSIAMAEIKGQRECPRLIVIEWDDEDVVTA